MAREIERRWLIDQQFLTWLYTARAKDVIQKYTVIDDAGDFERRIRYQDLDGLVTYTWTEKRGHGQDREEINTPASAADFEALGPGEIIGQPIEKTVFLHDLGSGLILELHAFKARLTGHVSLEIEFSDFTSAQAYTVPPWFGREVTDDVRYNGRNLCRYGLPKEER